MKYRVKSHHFRALMAAAAAQDVRYYLNGIYFNTADNRAVGTDGHRLLTVPFGVPDGTKGSPVIVGRPSKLPSRKCKEVDIEIVDDKRVEFHYLDKYNQTLEIQVGEVIDGRYPDYKTVMKGTKGKAKALESIGFNPLLIADVVKALGPTVGPVNFIFFGPNDAIKCEIGTEPDCEYVLMPCRV